MSYLEHMKITLISEKILLTHEQAAAMSQSELCKFLWPDGTMASGTGKAIIRRPDGTIDRVVFRKYRYEQIPRDHTPVVGKRNKRRNR